jgi:nicotinamide-nucleotide amidase
MCGFIDPFLQGQALMSNDSVNFQIERLAAQLLAGNMLLVTAESCTGGGLAEVMTSLPGSSRWFERGFVTYSNVAKQEMLGVSLEILQMYGAVSEQTAVAMAQGALDHSHAHVSVAITGIAGPDGGTESKPVGTVCFAWSRGPGTTVSATTVFKGDRRSIREQSVLMAIQGLLDMVEAGGG